MLAPYGRAPRMSEPVTIVGSYLSPYVRKVLVCLGAKGIPYRIDPIVPFFGDERFTKLSPLRRIPVLIDGELVLSDSTVICEYLEERHPEPAFHPRGPAARARARWLEEFADTRMGDVFIWRLFEPVVIGPAVWGEPTDREKLRETLEVDVPSVLAYLEEELPVEGFLFGASLGIADAALAAFFRNAAFARFTPDPARWPRTAGFVARALASAPFARLAPFEDACLRAPIPSHRRVLAERGAPLTPESLGGSTPRRGIMPIR
jgi:glutathione S-transferase